MIEATKTTIFNKASAALTSVKQGILKLNSNDRVVQVLDKLSDAQNDPKMLKAFAITQALCWYTIGAVTLNRFSGCRVPYIQSPSIQILLGIPTYFYIFYHKVRPDQLSQTEKKHVDLLKEYFPTEESKKVPREELQKALVYSIGNEHFNMRLKNQIE